MERLTLHPIFIPPLLLKEQRNTSHNFYSPNVDGKTNASTNFYSSNVADRAEERITQFSFLCCWWKDGWNASWIFFYSSNVVERWEERIIQFLFLHCRWKEQTNASHNLKSPTVNGKNKKNASHNFHSPIVDAKRPRMHHTIFFYLYTVDGKIGGTYHTNFIIIIQLYLYSSSIDERARNSPHNLYSPLLIWRAAERITQNFPFSTVNAKRGGIQAYNFYFSIVVERADQGTHHTNLI